MLVNWLRQVEGGLNKGTEENWDKYDVHTGQVRGGSSNNSTGWITARLTSPTTKAFVYDGIKRPRQQAWEQSAKNRPNYKGADRGVDEHTARKQYLKLAQKEPMRAR
eukprot:13286007-Heterocapsa_arctica.AAC.1